MTDLRSCDRRAWRFIIACAFAVTALTVVGRVQTAYAALTVHEVINRYTRAAGFGTLDVAAMKKIADYESHDRPRSHSKTCWGLFQLSTRMVKGHPWWDASWNTRRALRYVESRYGTPRKAWAHIKRTGWY